MRKNESMSRGVATEHRLSKQEAQAVALLQAGAKTSEIANALGVTQRQVQRILKGQQETIEDIDKKLSDVQRSIKKAMPIRDRVEHLVKVAKGDIDFAKIASIKYLNELDGIHPQLEREKLKKDQQQQQPAPMFMLPPGSRVSVTLTTTGSVSANNDGPSEGVIDVTPTKETE